MTLKSRPLFHARVLRWYRSNGRDLPWRNEHNPYRVLVSEIMLQQTQVARVLTKYPLFLKRFPSMKKLAEANASDVIKTWEGMGYNGRALRLKRLAEIVLHKHRGRLPESVSELEELPGIGRYTANALACFSFGKRVPVVDTNIRRVLTRMYPPKGRTSARKEEDIWTLAESLLPPDSSHDWNQALMDLGATICVVARPKCELCPLVGLCPSAHQIRRRKPGTRKSEPERDGIPNRIYRGRTVQALRESKSQRGLTISALARKIKPDFKSRDREWLNALLRGLQKDGLVRFRPGNRISLPE
jgi:A/G-specific adenine glycosylase